MKCFAFKFLVLFCLWSSAVSTPDNSEQDGKIEDFLYSIMPIMRESSESQLQKRDTSSMVNDVCLNQLIGKKL